IQVSDHLSSNDIIVDAPTGELVERSTYESFGTIESDYRTSRWSSLREPYGITGKEADVEVGLVYFGARYYAPGLGRWISPDPLTVHEHKADQNAYAYVQGRATMARDPDGRFAFL